MGEGIGNLHWWGHLIQFGQRKFGHQWFNLLNLALVHFAEDVGVLDGVDSEFNEVLEVADLLEAEAVVELALVLGVLNEPGGVVAGLVVGLGVQLVEVGHFHYSL